MSALPLSLPLDGVAARARERRLSSEVKLAVRPMRAYAEEIPEPGVGPLRFADFPYQEEWYSEEIADAEEVVWMKSSQVGMCLAGWTRVLTADLRWVPICDLQVGDELVSADEVAPAEGRKLRKAIITAKWERERPMRRLEFEDGRVLDLTAEHRLLVQRGQRPGSNMDWRTAETLKVGQRIRSVTLPPFTDADGDPFEDGWMAGLLDGEGCLRKRAAGAELVITQRTGAVYDRAVAYLRARGYEFGERVQANGVGRITLGRTHDVLRLLAITRPSRFELTKWWQDVKLPGTYGHGAERIIAIEDDWRPGGVVDIETSTGTFIAEGFVSHNSAYAWRWSVRQSDQFGETGLYIFPTDTHVREFGDERIEPAIEESRYLRSRILPRFVHTKSLKRIGAGFLHLRGSNSKAGAQSVAASFIVFDEYDHLDQSNLPQIERRISGARQVGLRPRIRRLGNPTVEGTGISEAYDASDQREWMVSCPACGEVQAIEWNANVRWQNAVDGPVMRPGRDEYEDPKRVVRAWRACRDCDVELDVRLGSWIAKVPGRHVIGFSVSRLIVPNADLRQIIVASRQTKLSELEAFHNNDLGLPWSPAEAALDAASILAAAQQGIDCPLQPTGYFGSAPVTMGVDVAGERDLNVRISEQLPPEVDGVANPRRALWVGTVDSFEKIAALMQSYRVHVCAVDANPERRMAKTLRAQFPGRVMLVEYDHRNESDALRVTETGAVGTALEGVPLKVRLNRTEAIDAMMDSIRQARNRPPLHPSQRYVEHLRALKRRTAVTADGKVRRLYETTGSQGDDFAHAEVYDLAATELWRMRQGIQQLQRPDRRLPDEEIGFRRVRLGGDDDAYTPGFGERL